ncbi:MAG TPA: diguanylate cyclase [Gemmatimonadaceae bacterium]|nr:diguanylate cyclase [Gemmatimonadaceae bacterium]
MDPVATSVLYIGREETAPVLRAALDLTAPAGSQRFALSHAPLTGGEGLHRLGAGGVDVLLVDAAASRDDAMDVLVRARIEAPEVPVVLLAPSVDGDRTGEEAVRTGAQDWVARDPLDGVLLARVLRYAIERERLQSTLRQLALTDLLTGLYNRRGFLTLADHHLRLAPRTRGLLLASADVPGLRRINDAHGRDEGDRAILAVAAVLKETFRASDVIARLGADDFGVLVLDAAEDTEDVIGPRLRANLKRHNAEHPELKAPLAVSLGVARYDSASPPIATELLARAMGRRAARE